MAEAVVRLNNLALGYRRGTARNTVLADVDLHVAKGEFVAIVGHSGVGKSTLLRVLAGLAQAQAGSVHVASASKGDARAVAMVFQEARLLPWRTVRHNVELGLEGLKISSAEKKQRVDDALALVHLADYGERWPHELSGGQRQRIGIARALAVRPQLLLMDEPFGALDAITRQALQDELLRIWAQTGQSILFVTHDIDEAVYLGDRVVLLAGAPASVVQTYAVTTARPRRRDSAELRDAALAIRAGLSERFQAARGTNNYVES